MNNRELFKEAIADAKAVKEAAIANAKVALEEAFAPFLREKLTQKLSEMEEETYESKDEMYEDEYGDSTDKDFLQNEMSYDEETIEAPVDEVDMMGDETIDELNLDELLAELELEEEASEEVSEEELNEAKEDEEEKEEEEEEDEDEEIDITDVESLKKIIEDEIEKMIESGELQAGPEYEGEEEEMMGDEEEMMGDEEVVDGEEMMGDEEEIEEDFSIDELLAELKKKGKKEMPKKEEAKKKEDDKAKKELDEAVKVIKALKGELQEMKLFNAKLLYTNKIFKARSLNESQKVKVLSTFDKATTIKEVELVYETLSSSFSTAKKQVVKESLGFASKPTGVSQHQQKQMIVEEDAMVTRFKKLAGLI
jgi:hypothetical protein